MKISHRTITASDNHKIDWDKLWEISDRYTGDTPLSGSWATELEHEQKAIADELGISMDEAKHLMIEHLEIPLDAFNHPLAASTKITADEELVEDSPSNMEVIDIERPDEDEENDPYILELRDAVIDKIVELREDIVVQFDSDEKNLYFTLTATDDLGYSDIMVYEVPRDDLEYNPLDDLKYIVSEMDDFLDLE